jgi:hypothetical protein
VKSIGRYVALLFAAVVLGAVLDLLFGPILSWDRHSDEIEEIQLPSAQEPQEAPLLSAAGSEPKSSPLESTAPSSDEEEATGPAPLTSAFLPPNITAVYQEIAAPSVYRDLLGPVRMYSLLDDIADVVKRDAAVWTTGEPLEGVARAAAIRRGKNVLPGGRYLMFAIPLDGGRHEVVHGYQPVLDLASKSQTLQQLAEELGVEADRVTPSSPGYEEALSIADSYIREKVRHRIRERDVLARLIASHSASGGALAGKFVVILPNEGGVHTLDKGAGRPEIDTLLREYLSAPRQIRAWVDTLVGGR